MRQLIITKSITNRSTASLDRYLQDISKEELITAEEEVKLAQKIRTGDQIALEKLTKELVNLKKEQQMMNEKFSKLAQQPAGEKVFDRKGYLSALQENQFRKLDAIVAMKNNKLNK